MWCVHCLRSFRSGWVLHVSSCWCRGNVLLLHPLYNGVAMRCQWRRWRSADLGDQGGFSSAFFLEQQRGCDLFFFSLGYSLPRQIALRWLMLPLSHISISCVGIIELVKVLFRGWFGYAIVDPFKSSTTAASSRRAPVQLDLSISTFKPHDLV